MRRCLAVLLLLVLVVPIASAGELGTPAKAPPPPGDIDTPGFSAVAPRDGAKAGITAGIRTHGEQQTPGKTPPPPSTDPGEVQIPGSSEPLWMQILKLWLSGRNR